MYEKDEYMKFREKLQRFGAGRNGADQLYQFLMWLCLILLLINLFVGSWILSLIELTILGYATFRLFSKNLFRRQQENRAFLKFWKRIRDWFVLCKNRFRDRKTHIYRKCPACRRMLRLPKINKGTHTVCCPCCGNRFDTNV